MQLLILSTSGSRLNVNKGTVAEAPYLGSPWVYDVFGRTDGLPRKKFKNHLLSAFENVKPGKHLQNTYKGRREKMKSINFDIKTLLDIKDVQNVK